MRSSLLLGAALLASAGQAADLAMPTDARGRFALVHRAEAAPVALSSARAASGNLDLARLGRFIATTTDRSYGLTFPEAFSVLEAGAEAVLDQFGSDLPPGVWVALASGLEGGRRAARSEDAWNILHTYMRRVGDDIGAFSDTSGVFDRLLVLGREASYDRLFASARWSLWAFFRALARRACDLGCHDSIDRLLKASYRAIRYSARDEDGWRALHTVLVELEARGDTLGLPLYLEVALEGSIGLLYESAFRFLETFAQHLLGSDMLTDPFDRLELQAALDASQSGSWQARYQHLRIALNALQDAGAA